MYLDTEDLIGKWFVRTGKRSDIFLAAIFASSWNEKKELIIRSDPEYVTQACEKSVKRLGISHIDLNYCHRLDMTTPIKTVEATTKLKRSVYSTLNH